MFQPVIDLLQAHNALSEPLVRKLKVCTFKKVFSPKHIELNEGQICRYVYFIEKGLLRSYIERENKEINIWFMMENDIAAAANSLLLQVPSSEYIQAMEKTEVICLSFENLMLLCAEFPAFQTMVLNLSWKYYAMFYQRVLDLLGLTNEERYQYLVEKQPELQQRVGRKLLSSYLGMSVTTMGRANRNLR